MLAIPVISKDNNKIIINMYKNQKIKNSNIKNEMSDKQNFLSSAVISNNSIQDQIISFQIPSNRRAEIREYLKLFGYKPETTILQIHIAGFFRKKMIGYSQSKEQKSKTYSRYGGASFIVVGRTHDPKIMELVIKPKTTNPLKLSPGYIGYLWKRKNINNQSPDEILPLDFTPVHLQYPDDWKKLFATKGFLVAMHVPVSFVKDKNLIIRKLYSISKTGIDIKKQWDFLNVLKNFGFTYTVT